MLKPYSDNSAPIGIVISTDDDPTDDDLPITAKMGEDSSRDVEIEFNIGN